MGRLFLSSPERFLGTLAKIPEGKPKHDFLLWLAKTSSITLLLVQGPSDSGSTTKSDVSPTEEQVVQHFYDLFTTYQKPITDFLYRMTRDREMAADLTQDTFLKVYAHRHELAKILNTRAWIYRIAVNTANNALRHHRRFTWLSLVDMQPDSSSSGSNQIVIPSADDTSGVGEREELAQALRTLSPTARSVLLLRVSVGFDIPEIATMLNITEANARKILYRAKEKLRAILESNQ